jgi:hypothetical protein
VISTTGPLSAVGGSSLVIAGNELAIPQAAQTFLGVPGTATVWDVSAWRQSAVQAGRISLELPAAYADPASALPPPPTATPLPGLYSLSVGSTPLATRSNAIPIAVAPRVDHVAIPPQQKPDASGMFAIAGAGFVPASTILALGALPLAKTAAPAPSAGEFTVNAAGTAISFMLPSPTPASGTYPVLIQVNGIAAAPGWVVVVP